MDSSSLASSHKAHDESTDGVQVQLGGDVTMLLIHKQWFHVLPGPKVVASSDWR